MTVTMHRDDTMVFHLECSNDQEKFIPSLLKLAKKIAGMEVSEIIKVQKFKYDILLNQSRVVVSIDTELLIRIVSEVPVSNLEMFKIAHNLVEKGDLHLHYFFFKDEFEAFSKDEENAGKIFTPSFFSRLVYEE